MVSKKIIVIGAGIGGIATATHLAREGCRVLVVEKNTHAGGRFDQLLQNGHCFDTGPTLLVMRLVYEAEFAALGQKITEVLELLRVDPTYHLVFDDGSHLKLTSDLKSMHDQLEEMKAGSFQGFMRYIEEGDRHYHVAMERLVNRDFRRASEFFNLKNLPLLYQVKPLVKHYQHMAAFFKNSRLKAAFSFQDVYMGLSPFESLATFSMMPYTELAHGVWYPCGGMYKVVEALEAIAIQAGVEFAYNTTVEEIVVNHNAVNGVIVEDGHSPEADGIVANADLPYVYQDCCQIKIWLIE